MGIAAYVVSGFFLYCVNFLLIFQIPEAGHSASAKVFVAAIFLIPALIAWVVGISIRGRARWRRDTGVLLLTTGIIDAFMALTFYCMFASPEMREAFPSKARESMTDYRSASICLLAYLVIGAILFLLGRRGSGRLLQ